MIQELHTASETLRVALERYLDICLTLTRHHKPAGALDNGLESILQEFQKITSYEKDIIHSRGLIGRLRNHYRTIVPVNSLPPEILTRIFCLARPSKRILNPSSLPVEMSLSSQTDWILLQVCSYWGTVVLGSHDLWTHIDLPAFTPDDKWMLGRARQFVSLSSERPLAVHAKVGPLMIGRDEQCIFDLCALISPRVKDLSLFIASTNNEDRLTICRALLGKCLPGRLTRLAVETGVDHPSTSLIATDDPIAPPGVRASHEYIERVLRHVTALHLKDIFLPWSSQVYSGLVKLHLDDSGTTVSLPALAQVLRASPQLRFFWFGTFLAPNTEYEVHPVRLDQLEVLRLDLYHVVDHENVMSLIHPGADPLYVNISFLDEEMQGVAGLLTSGEHKRFFQRSNVNELHASMMGDNQSIEIAELLRLLPDLEVLSLLGFDITHESYLDINSQLAEVHLRAADIDWDAMEYIIGICPINIITVDAKYCRLVARSDEDEGMDWDEAAAVLWPVLEFVTDFMGPSLEDWD